MVSRYTLLIAVFVLAYAGLVFHLYNVQLTQGQHYLARAESQYAAGQLLLADRGAIYFTDKNGHKIPAVTNKKFPLVYAVPKMVEDAAEAANLIAPVLGGGIADIQAKLSKPNDLYEVLKKKAPRSVADGIRGLELKGIYVDEVPERFYPFETLAAHLLGYVGPKSDRPGQEGRYGLEEFYEDRLAGVPGEMKGNKIIPPEPGQEIALTLDPNIQIESARVLRNLVDRYQAKGGTVIVQDPRTGRILALESSPHFDPNSYSESDLETFLNPATQKIYEPGSVAKVLTMAAGIDTGKIGTGTVFNDPGVLELNGRKIYNWDLKAHGTVTMTNVLELSLNTGAAFVQRRTGEKEFRQYLERFGLGEKSGVDLPGEVNGDLRRLEDRAPAIAFATASFGQGIAVTPIQMVNAIAALANGGMLMRPYVNAELKPQELGRVVSPETARQVTDMMVSAVDKAKVAKIKGYSIAGKTGTAQVPDLQKGGYSEDKYIHSYVGFGPTRDPRFVILLKLDEPNAPLAGATVVPAFRDLAQFILNYYNVPPDRLTD